MGNEEGVSLAIEVEAAPWSSGWAWLVYLVAGSGLAYYLWRESQRRRSLRLKIDEVVRTSERRLNLALLGSGDGLWDWDITSGEIHRSRIAEPLGYTSDELPRGHDFRRELIHPDDQARASVGPLVTMTGAVAVGAAPGVGEPQAARTPSPRMSVSVFKRMT